MKRIIEGNTYNTDTATLVAEGHSEDNNSRTEIALYQNPAGVFFSVDTVTASRRDRHGEWNEATTYEWEVIGDVGKAREKCEAWGLTIIRDTIEDMPPEAELGEKMATLYIRLPPSLKAAIEATASAQGTSVNVFALRCLEGCVAVTGAGTTTQRPGPLNGAQLIRDLMKDFDLSDINDPGRKTAGFSRGGRNPALFSFNSLKRTLEIAMGPVPQMMEDEAWRKSVVSRLQALGLRVTGLQYPTIPLADVTDWEGFEKVLRDVVQKAYEPEGRDASRTRHAV